VAVCGGAIMSHQNRKYIFEIYYDLDDERCKMAFTFHAPDDLTAFTYLCEEPEYQNLDYSQNIALNMRSM
jgi:hypothetical protein